MKVLRTNHLVVGSTCEAEANIRSPTRIFSALVVRLPTLNSKFPYLSVLCCYCLIVYRNYVMICLALRETVSNVIRG